MTQTTFHSVFDALSDTPQQAANLRLRADLMMRISQIIAENGWTQAQAAEHCGLTQPRTNDLLKGKIDKFSLDALVNIHAALGRRVSFQFDDGVLQAA